MKHHAGILDGTPRLDEAELLILVHTPGIPLEWVMASFPAYRRRQIRDLADQPAPPEADENAASITEDDALEMLRVIGPRYTGAIPLYSKLALNQSDTTAKDLAREFGVSKARVNWWRTRNVFCPLTGVRLIPMRGAPRS